MKRIFVYLISAIVLSCLGSCQSIPKGATAVSPFDADRYLGTWYEIARIDFTFEKNLDNTTANYSKRPDGKIAVLNKGFNLKKNKWTDAKGKAKFRGDKNIAELAVSFFGPFYGGYNVVALEGDYEYALVTGKNVDYLWILARKPTIPNTVKEQFLAKAKTIGYDISRLNWISHDKKKSN
ncbi:MAG: hypothetical protein GY810_03345 [Aureispira sp.]|nr:hypothetical protein [Aureispira sp.]